MDGRCRLAVVRSTFSAYLPQRRGDVVTKDQLMERVWRGRVVEENNIQVHISALRKALADGNTKQRHVVTVPGRGYRLVGVQAPATLDEAKSESSTGADNPVEASRDLRAAVRKELEGQSKAAILILPIVCEEAQSPELEQEAARLTSDLIDFAPTISNLRRDREIDFEPPGHAIDRRQRLGSRVWGGLRRRRQPAGVVRSAARRHRIDRSGNPAGGRWNGHFESDATDAAARRLEIVRGLARQLLVATTELLGTRPLEINQELVFPEASARLVRLSEVSLLQGGEEGQRIFEEILLDHPSNKSALLGLSSFKISAAYKLARTDRQALVNEAEQLIQRALAIELKPALPISTWVRSRC